MKKSFLSSPLKIAIFVFLIFVIVLTVLVIRHQNSNKISSETIKTVNSQPNTNSGSSSTNSSNKDVTPTNPDKPSTNSHSTTNDNLAAPYGSFVSNHKPGQNGSDLTEQSQCTTTHGATCYIKFTQNNVEKTLPQQTIDSSGTTFWEWKINEAGLTSGQWSVMVVATLNGQTKTTKDQLTLEVK